MVFPTHGYRGETLWLPCFCDIWPWRRPTWVTPWLGDAFTWVTPYLDDASFRRRPASAMLALGVSSPRRRLMLTLTPRVDFDLDFVNARIRDGTWSIINIYPTRSLWETFQKLRILWPFHLQTRGHKGCCLERGAMYDMRYRTHDYRSDAHPPIVLLLHMLPCTIPNTRHLNK